MITAITIVSCAIHDRGMRANLTPVFLGITVWLTAIMLTFGRDGDPLAAVAILGVYRAALMIAQLFSRDW